MVFTRRRPGSPCHVEGGLFGSEKNSPETPVRHPEIGICRSQRRYPAEPEEWCCTSLDMSSVAPSKLGAPSPFDPMVPDGAGNALLS